MDITIHAAIDHLSILNFDLRTSADVFFLLGFVREGGKNALDESVFEMMVPTSRFVFDNAYVECVQFPPTVSEFYGYLNSPAGIHIIALLTQDAEKFRLGLREQGVNIEELDRVTRKDFDYGEKKGTAIMLLAPIPYEIIRRTHIAFLEHKTRDLIYQPTRYKHPNGVTVLKGVTICCRSEEEAAGIQSELTKLCALAQNQQCVGGAREIRLMDPDSIKREYGITTEPDGSAFAAVTFGVPEMETLRRHLDEAPYPYVERDGQILVNQLGDMGMAFAFQTI